MLKFAATINLVRKLDTPNQLIIISCSYKDQRPINLMLNVELMSNNTDSISLDL